VLKIKIGKYDFTKRNYKSNVSYLKVMNNSNLNNIINKNSTYKGQLVYSDWMGTPFNFKINIKNINQNKHKMNRIIDPKKLRPVANRVVIQPDAKADKSAGGVILPEKGKPKQLTGTVIAVGPGRSNEKMIVKKGDSVIFGEYSGTEIGDGLIVMEEHHILCIID